MRAMFLGRFLAVLTVMTALASCSAPLDDLSKAATPLGNFKLGYNIVVVDNPEILPLSRTATDAEWKAAMEKAVADRFGRFQGDTPYHIALKVQGYALAQPGVPVVATPKSALVVSANVWATYGKLNPEPENLTIFESVSAGNAIVGSGLANSKEQQMANLSANAARQIEEWLRQHPEWFTGDFPAVPGTGPVSQ